eukprot:3374057-Prymnesium_polylepis.1
MKSDWKYFRHHNSDFLEMGLAPAPQPDRPPVASAILPAEPKPASTGRAPPPAASALSLSLLSDGPPACCNVDGPFNADGRPPVATPGRLRRAHLRPRRRVAQRRLEAVDDVRALIAPRPSG